MAKRNYFANTWRYKEAVAGIHLQQLEDGRKAPKFTRRAKVRALQKRTRQQIVQKSLHSE